MLLFVLFLFMIHNNFRDYYLIIINQQQQNYNKKIKNYKIKLKLKLLKRLI